MVWSIEDTQVLIYLHLCCPNIKLICCPKICLRVFQETVCFVIAVPLLCLWKWSTNPGAGAKRCLLQAPTFSNPTYTKISTSKEIPTDSCTHRGQSLTASAVSYSSFRCQSACLCVQTQREQKAKHKWQPKVLDCQVWQTAGYPMPNAESAYSASNSWFLPDSPLFLAPALPSVWAAFPASSSSHTPSSRQSRKPPPPALLQGRQCGPCILTHGKAESCKERKKQWRSDEGLWPHPKLPARLEPPPTHSPSCLPTPSATAAPLLAALPMFLTPRTFSTGMVKLNQCPEPALWVHQLKYELV